MFTDLFLILINLCVLKWGFYLSHERILFVNYVIGYFYFSFFLRGKGGEYFPVDKSLLLQSYTRISFPQKYKFTI